MPKKYSNHVYACPECWFRCKMLINHENPGKARKKWPYYFLPCDNDNCRNDYLFKNTICFDSQAEAAAGFIFKEKERKGIIKNLWLHPTFLLFPSPWIFKNKPGDGYVNVSGSIINFGFIDNDLPTKDKKKIGAVIKIWKNDLIYTTDFAFAKEKELRVVEVKAFDKSRRSPYFAGDSKKRKTHEREFAHVCHLMKLIHKLDVFVYSGGLWWKWDANFKKLEVIKNVL